MNKAESLQPGSQEFIINKEKVHHEDEKKYLIDLNDVPHDLSKCDTLQITQGYLTIDPGKSEERLRKQVHLDGSVEYFYTKKAGSGEDRLEQEKPISEKEFEELWQQRTIPGIIEKTRYLIPDGNYLIELDIFHGKHEGLVMTEVEFKTPELKKNFIAPSWFGREVTLDKRFKNQALVLYGLPSPEHFREAPRFTLDEGVEKSIEEIQEILDSNPNKTSIIAIAGGSASGKTSQVAHKISKKFSENALLISMDDYYRGAAYIGKEAKKGNLINWDQPEAVDLELLKDHLSLLKQGKTIQKPIYSFKTGERTGYEPIDPKNLIIIEGLFALNNNLKDQSDYKIFVDIGTHGRIIRRLLRDIDRTSQKPSDIVKYFAQVVEPMHEKHIQKNIINADIIVENEYNPSVEAQRSNVNENQVKFLQTLSPAVLRKAELLCHINQTDSYYTPFGKDLKDTDEILRIRQENGFYILTYKGPKNETSTFRERPKLEFEIDEGAKDAFINFYGRETKMIQKSRAIYTYKGTVFSIDNVSTKVNNETRFLGNFVEIRSTKDKDLDSIFQEMGLDPNTSIKKSYFEL